MTRAIAVTNLAYSAADLRRLMSKHKDGRVVRRLLALALILEGNSRTEAAQMSGMERQTLRDWVHRYNAEGLSGLSSRISAGPRPKLSEAQMAELGDLVVNGPDPETDKVVRWRCVDLREQIARRFSVEVHEHTVGKWLHQLDMTRLQPRPFHPKKDIAAQEAYKNSAPCARKLCQLRQSARTSKSGLVMKPESDKRVRSSMIGRRSAHARRWYAIIGMTPFVSSARSAQPEASGPRSSCRRSTPRR